MSGTCCFISFFDELDAANNREKERLEFVLSGALFYLTYAKDVKEYLFPYSGYLPAIANHAVSAIKIEEPTICSTLVIPKKARESIPFSFYLDKWFDKCENVAREGATLKEYYRALIDRADYCFFYFDKKCVSREEKELFAHAKRCKKIALNVFPSENIFALFKVID